MPALTKQRKQELNRIETKDTKQCYLCREIKPLFEFAICSNGRKFSNSYCLECEKEKNILRRSNITLKEYDKLLEKQNGKCAICGTETPGGPGRFHIDHDHPTGEIRGLLCNNCNRALGLFKDNPEILMVAAQYLMRKSL